MNFAGVIFGAFCLFAITCGGFYIFAQAQNQPTYTDTYGNSISEQTSTIQNDSYSVVTPGVSSGIWLLLIVGAIVVCCVVFMIYLAAKTHFF